LRVSLVNISREKAGPVEKVSTAGDIYEQMEIKIIHHGRWKGYYGKVVRSREKNGLAFVDVVMENTRSSLPIAFEIDQVEERL
jgi:hypothetical protein